MVHEQVFTNTIYIKILSYKGPSSLYSISYMTFIFQGEIVDSIEANIEDTTVRVHEGASELRQAELYKVTF